MSDIQVDIQLPPIPETVQVRFERPTGTQVGQLSIADLPDQALKDMARDWRNQLIARARQLRTARFLSEQKAVDSRIELPTSQA